MTALLLAACGGGGGGGSQAPANNGNGGGGANPPAAFTRLWVPYYQGGELRAWNHATLANDVDGAPDVTIALPANSKPNALTFDATGALWVTDNGRNKLMKLTAAQIANSGAPTPQVTIDSDGVSLAAPIGLAFDRDDDLWVAVAGRIEMYVPSNLDDSGPTTPNRVLQCDDFDLPAHVMFDAGGNLWTTNASFTASKNAVMVFTPKQLDEGGRQIPRLTIRSSAFALVEGMQLDAHGDLLVASNDGNNIARFAAADVAVPVKIVSPTGMQRNSETRTLAPASWIVADADGTATGRSAVKPGGMAFDSEGNLFVNSERGAMGGTDSAVLEFGATQLQGVVGSYALQATVMIRRATSNPGFGGLVLERE